MNQIRRLAGVLVVMFATIASGVIGCQKNPLGLASVQGTVTLDGENVSDAIVTFYPVSQDGLTASGKTDQNGRFLLNTAGGGDVMGAKPGEYQVTVVKKEGFYGSIAPRTSEQQSGKPSAAYVPTAGAAPKAGNLLPAGYEKKETSGLTFNVSKGKNICDLTLTTK